MTESTPKTLLRIRELYNSFHGNYVRIADRFLRNPEMLIRDKISDVAASCNCDNAQIIRFCQKLGFKGFSDMKRAISHDLIPIQTRVEASPVRDKQSFSSLLDDFRRNYLQTINDTAAVGDENSFRQAVDRIKKARTIMLCGLGASGIVCEDLQMKLVHMGYSAFFYDKPTMNKMTSSLLEKNDLMIVISFRGENKEILNYAKVAKNNDCPIIAICNYSQSAVARIADTVLLTSSDENDFRIGAMTSRLSQLMIVDILSVMLALNDIRKTERNLAKTHIVLKENCEA